MVTNANAVAKNLWVGGVPWQSDKVDGKFDGLVLAAKEYQDVFPVHKYPKTEVIHVPLVDGKLSNDEECKALEAALKVHDLNKAGKKVLVTCAAGVNRSALIAALAMVISGIPAEKAIAQIRKHRKPLSGSTPLFNEHFVKMLKRIDLLLTAQTEPKKPLPKVIEPDIRTH